MPIIICEGETLLAVCTECGYVTDPEEKTCPVCEEQEEK